MWRLTWLVAVVSLAQAPQAPPAGAASQAAATASVAVRVTDRTGLVLEAARVAAEGPVSRDGVTDRSGGITFKNMNAGTYRLRIEHDGFVTLEKEVTLRAGAPGTAEAALSPAPPPPAPPPVVAPAPVAPPAPTFTPGEAAVVSIPDMADRTARLGTDPLKESALGCSGATAARLIQARDAILSHKHADADETIYVVAGEATLTIAGKDYPLTPGSFAVVPRGSDHALVRKGKNPMILLSTLGGPPCPKK